MDNRGLLFIPDISGFTKFVHESEIDHSRFIIQELLETLINANQIGLEVSEIEGDAILFYKYGDPPTLDQVYNQVKQMFCSFHSHLLAYEHRRICQCKACVSAVNLSLKVVTHYGEFTGYNVKQFKKLIGKDVIVAHQLLKNDIEKHEYWLVTRNLLQDKEPVPLAEWMKWMNSSRETETGTIPFHFTQLSELKARVEPEPLPNLGLSEKVKMISVSREYDTDIKHLFFTAIHFEFRHLWREEVKAIEDVNHSLPGVGTRHRCVLAKGQMIMYTSSFSYNPDQKIEYSETDEKKECSVFYIMERTGGDHSRLTMELYLKKNWFLKTIFSLTLKNKMEGSFRRSLVRLDDLLKQIQIPVEF